METMPIGSHLVQARAHLVREDQRGFNPNPTDIPEVVYLAQLEEMRSEKFLAFRRKLANDGILIIKVVTNAKISKLQEGVLLSNLAGDAVLVNLKTVSNITDDGCRKDEHLQDLKAFLKTNGTLKIVDQVADLVNFGQRVHEEIKEEDYVELTHWHPFLNREYCASLRHVFTERFDHLVAPFRISDTEWSWKWDLKTNAETAPPPTLLGHEQRRLIYALKSSLIHLVLDGIVLRTYAEPVEELRKERLGEQLAEILNEELLQDMVTDEAMETDQGNDAKEIQTQKIRTRKVQYPEGMGATWAHSLGFGRLEVRGVQNLKDDPSRIMEPQRKFVNDVTEWEQLAPFVVVVNRLGEEPCAPQMPPPPAKSCIKSFDPSEIRYNVARYNQDPDTTDRDRFRFPNLDTAQRKGVSRTASPPPRMDDPDGIWTEYERRRHGMRFMGPPLPKQGAPKSKSFVRARQWELSLPDEEFGGWTKSHEQSSFSPVPGASRGGAPTCKNFGGRGEGTRNDRRQYDRKRRNHGGGHPGRGFNKKYPRRS